MKSEIVATPALRSQFGPRLATVYAPLLLASFGSGAQQIDIRYIAPGGTAAFEGSVAAAKQARVEAGVVEVLAGRTGRVVFGQEGPDPVADRVRRGFGFCQHCASS